MLDASPLKNSFIGRIIHDRYQNHLQKPDGSLTLASILNETLSKLKGRKPNKPYLKPLNVETPTKVPQPDGETFNRYGTNQWLHDSYFNEQNPENASADRSKNGSRLNVLNFINDGHSK
jgi:hypothetical protein